MKIRVEFVGQFRNITGTNDTVVHLEEGSTVQHLVNKLAEKYGKKFEERIFVPGTKNVSEEVTIVLNGRVVPVEEASSTVLNEADTVILMPEAII